MLEELKKLVSLLPDVEKYDKENALIDIYIHILTHREELGKNDLLDAFAAVSGWRDFSLADGSETYYEVADFEPKEETIKAVRKHASAELAKMYEYGFKEAEGNFDEIDAWIFDNQWKINDWLHEIIVQYVKQMRYKM